MAAQSSYKKTVGTTTNASGAGTAVGGAVALVVSWLLSLAGIEVPFEVTGAMSVIFSVVGAYIGGWLSPSKKAEYQEFMTEAMSRLQVTKEAPEVEEYEAMTVEAE